MTPRPGPAFVLLTLLGLAPSATAQIREIPPSGERPRPAAAASTSAEEAQDLPVVDDPMMDPVPEAPNILRSWRQALRMIRSQSPNLRIARARVAQAEGQARQAKAGSMPQVTGTATATSHLLFGRGVRFGAQGFQPNAVIPDPASFLLAGIEVRQPVLAPETWYRIGTARITEQSAKLSAEDTERLLLGQAADAIVAVVTAERLAETSRVSLQSALSTFDLTRRRALLGAASAVDVLRAEQEVAQSRGQVVASDEQVRRARETLGLALGDSVAWGVTTELGLAELQKEAVEICRPVARIEARADVRAAAKNVEIAARNETTVDYRYSPQVDLLTNFNFTADPNRSINGRHVTWTVGAGLIWPLYDGGERAGDRHRAEAETRIAREELTDIKRNARIEVVQAQRAVAVARANLEVTTQTRDIARESARLARIAFVSGTGTSFDLVDSARRLREAELDLTVKQLDLARAQIAALLAAANCRI